MKVRDLAIKFPPQIFNLHSVNLLNPLECTGLKPQFLEKMAANGVSLPPSFFGNTSTFRPNYAAASYGGFE